MEDLIKREIWPLDKLQAERMTDIARRAVEWLRNGGVEQIAEAVRVSNEASAAFRKACKPIPETLRQPMDI